MVKLDGGQGRLSVADGLPQLVERLAQAVTGVRLWSVWPQQAGQLLAPEWPDRFHGEIGKQSARVI